MQIAKESHNAPTFFAGFLQFGHSDYEKVKTLEMVGQEGI